MSTALDLLLLSEPICAVGHGVAALCCATNEDRSWVFQGYSVTGVSVAQGMVPGIRDLHMCLKTQGLSPLAGGTVTCPDRDNRLVAMLLALPSPPLLTARVASRAWPVALDMGREARGALNGVRGNFGVPRKELTWFLCLSCGRPGSLGAGPGVGEGAWPDGTQGRSDMRGLKPDRLGLHEASLAGGAGGWGRRGAGAPPQCAPL